MILVYTALQASVSSSFSECYSAKSYINGNDLTYQLNLHLIPFERLAQITDENLCKMYLPDKIVVAQIHYDDISFPIVGSSEVNFVYKFNKEQIVTFQLSPADYSHIKDKKNAMYELWYDVNLVKVNNSVNTIEHTKYNGTNCFQNAQMEYTVYGDIDINVIANNCAVKMDPALQVYLEFQSGLSNEQINIYPCTTGCSADEYQTSSTQFNTVTIYRIKKTAAIAAQLASFYEKFVENRRIRITMNLKFDTNGINTVITKEFDNILAKDTHNCKTHDTHLSLFAVLNSDSVQLQYRDSFINRLECDLPGVVSARVDLYLYDNANSLRIQETYEIEEFNENVGVAFKNIEESNTLRFNHDDAASKTIMVVSYLNSSGQIIYDLIVYNDPFYVACVNRAVLHLHKSESCIDYYFENIPKCVSNLVKPTEKNNLGVFYQENKKTHSLGLYKFHRVVDYSLLRQQLCFVCDEYVADTIYAKQTCKENQAFTKEKIKSAEIGFAIISKYEFIIFKAVVAEYQNTYIPFVVTTILFAIFITVSVFVLYKRYSA
ncbi:Conserved_hypothetical protein [Hexamita inflata]|uniref:Uncharacterized protein n=1 Tax=Hexamita inflata TaxID=28002 RepID=A0AA86P9W4_9EUKA|nr:Conserved hypothetical protein [Hexamita inflata]